MSDQTALLIAKWRADADQLSEGNKGEFVDTAAVILRRCADELEAALRESPPVPVEPVQKRAWCDVCFGLGFVTQMTNPPMRVPCSMCQTTGETPGWRQDALKYWGLTALEVADELQEMVKDPDISHAYSGVFIAAAAHLRDAAQIAALPSTPEERP